MAAREQPENVSAANSGCGSSQKKRRAKVTRNFNPRWESEFLCCAVSGTLQCLVCHKALKQIKKYNVQRHYVIHHQKNYASLQGVQREEKIEELKSELSKQQEQQQQPQQILDVTHIEPDSAESADSGGFTQDAVTYMTSDTDQQQYCLKWKFYQNNQQTMFSKLLQRESFCDVTIACEERILRAHKLLLSACSSYFEKILSLYEDKNPIIILKDVKFNDMSALLQFMYNGEINIEQSQLCSLLEAAELLKVKGLTDICREACRLNTPLETSDFKTEEQSDANSIFESPRTARHMGQRISIPEENVDGASQHSSHHDSLDIEREARGMDDPLHASSIIKTEEHSVESPTLEPTRKVRQKRRVSIPEENFQRPQKIACRKIDTRNAPTSSHSGAASSSPTNLTERATTVEGVIHLAKFLEGHGTYQQFWEKPWVVKALKDVSVGEMTLRNCSDLLGVGYDVLYSRYKEVHGELKSYEQVRSAAESDQVSKIVVIRDRLSPTTSVLPEMIQSDKPARTTDNTVQPIVNIKVEPCSSLADDFQSETMEDNTEIQSDGEMS